MSLKKILLIGIIGAGKGTQAKLLDLSHISTGEVIREAFEKKDALLFPYKEHIDKGGLLPDELIFGLIEQHIQKLPSEKGYILDGSVRTIGQAEFVLKKNLINYILDFKLSEDEARKRIEMRRTIENRKDDFPEAVEKRLVEYWTKTFPASEYLREHCPEFYFPVNASLSIEKVHEEILKLLYN